MNPKEIAEEIKQKVDKEKKIKDKEREDWEEKRKKDGWIANQTKGKYL